MADEFGEFSERQPQSTPQKKLKMTLEKAIEMGEYNPDFLSTFPEWSTFTNYIRWHHIRRAIVNRRRFLLLNYAETNNVLDLRLKPEMKLVMDRIYRQLDLLAREEERLRLEFIK
jgi:hypothetical protein